MRVTTVVLFLVIGMQPIGTRCSAQEGPEPLPGVVAKEGDQPRPMPATFKQDLRSAVNNAPEMKPMGLGVQWEAAGARLTLPAGEGEQRNSGLATNFRVQGDFEITATYEVLRADKPSKGYGNGVSLYASLNPNGGNDNAVSLGRRVTPAGNIHFSANRMLAINGKIKNNVKSVPGVHPIGKLRIQRVGAKVRFWAADGANADFVQINEADFDRGDVHFTQFGGGAGGSDAGLDMRLLDFTIRAETLPDLADAPVPAAPQAEAPANNAAPARGWLVAAGLIGLALLFLFLFLVIVAVIMLKRRKPRRGVAVQQGHAQPTSHEAPISFVCSECGKPLKIRASAANKKFRCPHCSKLVSAGQIQVK